LAKSVLYPFSRLVRDVPWTRTVGVLALMFIAALTEGVSIVMLVPMLSAAGDGGSGAVHLFAAMGLSVSLETLLAIFVVLVVARALLIHAHTLAGLRFQHEVIDGLRAACFSGLIRSEWRWLSQTRTSDHASLLTNNTERISFGLHQLLTLLGRSLAALACLGAAFLLSWPITLAAVLGGVIAVGAFRGQRKRTVELGVELGNVNRVIQSEIEEGLKGVRLTKILGQEQAKQMRLRTALFNLRTQVYRHAANGSVGRIITQSGGALLMVVLVYCGLIVWKLPLPQLLPVLLVFARLVPMIESVQQGWNYWLHSIPALEETYALIDKTQNYAEPVGNGEALQLRERLCVEQASFAYGDRIRPSLIDVSFTLSAHSTTALIGVSGAGKSSLADMIIGLITPDSGRVTVDNNEITGSVRQAWRRSTAYVQQDTFLFNDTIRANLQIAKRGSSDADLVAALELASAEFVFKLPAGLDTVVGDGGLRLSGGERQRIAIARAMLATPQLLILDEATSALDPENEREVCRAVAALRGKITLLIIGHRLTMLDQADQIIRIDGGRIVDIDHPQLLASSSRQFNSDSLLTLIGNPETIHANLEIRPTGQ
jgi:ATP-binding cassette, subfamily C, bacterial